MDPPLTYQADGELALRHNAVGNAPFRLQSPPALIGLSGVDGRLAGMCMEIGMAKKFDRAAEDLGNIVALEHVNVTIPDQRLSTLFYVTGLGLTRDPYLMTSTNNMWVNVGRNQFHLPTDQPQVLRGRVGLVMPNLDALARRLEGVRDQLAGTCFDFKVRNAYVDVTCPWGNRIRCHAPNKRYGRMSLGMPYVQLDVPPGAAGGIAGFYDEIMGAVTSVDKADGAPAARVSVGYRQELVFRETDAEQPEFDNHHIQVYIADFSGPYEKLLKRGLVSREDNQHQYRFMDITDLDSGEVLFTLEHEVRSMTHPLFARPLVNRNPDQTIFTFAPGHETRSWADHVPA